MVICPACENHEVQGALFCSQCGEQLVPVAGDSSPITLAYLQSQLQQEMAQKKTARVAPVADISLYLVESDQIIPLRGKKEVNLGRLSEGQPVPPDVDLNPYKAYEAGVSRLHASIRQGERGLVVVDLGSANGTRVNGKMLNPHTPYPVDNGDVLTLGRLKVQILIRS